MPNDLRIQVVVDGSQVPSGMTGVATTVEAATARIKAAFGSVEKAPAGIQNALLVLQNQARMSAETIATATESINALGGASSRAVPGMQQLSSATDQATRSITEARLAAQLLGHEVGVQMPRALTTVLARSATLGPALNAAFSGIAIAGFIELAVIAGDKLSKLISDTFIFTDAQKTLYTQLVADNQKLVALEELHQKALRDIAVVGLPLVEQQRLRARWAKEDREGLAATLKAKEQELDVERQTLRALQQKKEAQSPEFEAGTGIPQVPTDDFDKQIEQQESKITALSSSVAVLRSQYQLAGDAVEAAQKKFSATALKDSEKAATKYQAAMEKLARELRHISDEQERLDVITRKLADDESEFGQKSANAEAVADAKELGERQAAEREFQQGRIDDAKQASLTVVEVEQDKVKELFRLGKVSADQQAQQLNALESQKLNIEKQYLQTRIDEILGRLNSDDAKTYQEDLKEWSKLLSDKQKAEDAYQKNREKNVNNAATTEEKVWTKLTSKINAAFDQSIKGLISGTENFGTAFARLFDNLLADFVGFLAKQALKWAENHLLMLALHSSFLTNILGLDTANNAVKTAENATAAGLQVTQQAGVAGAGAFASVIAGLPFPLNVATAPGVMAAAIGTTLSNLTLASAAGGWDVPKDSLAMVHANEMILPANISAGLKGLIGGRAGGDVTISPTYNISAVDSKGVEDVLTRNSAHLAKLMQRELRKANVI
jgi:hypothetical protein